MTRRQGHQTSTERRAGLLSRLGRSGHAYGDIERLLQEVTPKGLCLDLPAGRGVNYRGILNAGFEPVEADLFPGKAGPPEARRVRLDFNERLPFAGGSFAAVLCSEGIEHHPAQSRLIGECKRVLRPGGTLLVTTPNTLNLRARASIALNGHYSFSRRPVSEKTQFWTAPDGTGSFTGHAHMIDYFELRFLLKVHGFDLVATGTAKYSGGAIALAPLLYLPVRFFTRRLLGKHLRDHPEIRREMVRDVLSADLLFGKKLIVVARLPA